MKKRNPFVIRGSVGRIGRMATLKENFIFLERNDLKLDGIVVLYS